MQIENICETIEKMIEKISDCTKSAIENDEVCVGQYSISDCVDMIKDLCEAKYHATVTCAMENADDEDVVERLMMYGRRGYDTYRYKSTGEYAPKGHGTYVGRYGYVEPNYHMPLDIYHNAEYTRDMDRNSHNRMSYIEPTVRTSDIMRTSESNYDRAKRNYTETREMHKGNTVEDKEHKMKSLDGYVKELGSDITSMIADMSQEEKNLLKTKLSTLVSKI